VYCTFADRLSSKLARRDSLALKLSQRPPRAELVERNILRPEAASTSAPVASAPGYAEDERLRASERSAIGVRLIRRLSLRPTVEELEERNIIKSELLSALKAKLSAFIAFLPRRKLI